MSNTFADPLSSSGSVSHTGNLCFTHEDMNLFATFLSSVFIISNPASDFAVTDTTAFSAGELLQSIAD